MASAKKCDICGSFYIPENDRKSCRIKIIIDSARPYDLCDECQHNLEVFAKLAPEDRYNNTQETNDELDIPMQAINDGSSNHDAYKIYKCPKCEKKFHKYQARLGDHRCPYCKQKLNI